MNMLSPRHLPPPVEVATDNVDLRSPKAQGTSASRRGMSPRQPAHSSTVVSSARGMRLEGANMETISTNQTARRRSRGHWRRKYSEGPIILFDNRASELPFEGLRVDACQGHRERAGVPHGSFPMSYRHSVGSASQEAYRALWTAESDRAERWARVRTVGLIVGLGTPLRAITTPVRNRAIWVMRERGMSKADIARYLDSFACLMLWADGWGFVRWGRSSELDTAE